MHDLRQLGERATAHLISPRRGPGVCGDCLNLTRGYDRCYACAAGSQQLAAVLPVSYSVAGEHLHSTLAAYKRAADPSVEAATAELAGILWRFLEAHEPCVAAAAGVPWAPNGKGELKRCALGVRLTPCTPRGASVRVTLELQRRPTTDPPTGGLVIHPAL